MTPPLRPVRQALADGVVRFGGTRAGRVVARRVAGLDAALQNDSAKGAINGERWLLERLAPLRPATVFDVGANRGDWTRMALRALPGAVVHAFEPMPEPFAALDEAFARDPRVRCAPMGLSDHDGTAEMWVHEHDTSASLIPEVPGRVTQGPVEVQLRSGAGYCAQAGVDEIDLLKLDVEGHEIEVLAGFVPLLEAGSVHVVQFEFTAWAVLARRWLRDYVDFFGGYGMQVGKLYSHQVDWAPYRVEQERFLRCNHVAVRPGSPQHLALSDRRRG